MITIKKSKSIRVYTFVFILMFTLSSMSIWASASSSRMLTLNFTTTGNFRGKGSYLQASSGTITVELPSEYTYEYTKTIGQVTSSGSYGYVDLGPLTLVEKISVQIHIDGSFRRLNVGDTAAITELYITGYSIVSLDGVQYGAQVGSSNIGTITMTGPKTWAVEATFQTSEQSPTYLGVARVREGNVEDYIPIPLYDFEVVCTGTITM